MEKSHLNKADVKPYEFNAKMHPEEQILNLARVIREVGWRQPVIVNQQGIIIVGHGRWLTDERYAIEMGLPEIWIIDDMGRTVCGGPDQRALTPEQERMYRVADNKLNETLWDNDKLYAEIKLMPVEMKALAGCDKIDIGDTPPVDLIGEEKNKPFSIKATFQSQEDMENARVEFDAIVARYAGAYLSVSGGEL